MRMLVCAIGAGLFFPGLVRADDKPAGADALKEDLRNLQGKWEYTFKDQDGQVILRKVKEVKDNTERVTWYAPDGTVRAVNTVEFKLEARGKDRVFSYFNGKVVEGPAKGQPFQGGSFSYALDGDTWTEIDESGVRYAWKRVKQAEKK
jgi:hypothetical protein